MLQDKAFKDDMRFKQDEQALHELETLLSRMLRDLVGLRGLVEKDITRAQAELERRLMAILEERMRNRGGAGVEGAATTKSLMTGRLIPDAELADYLNEGHKLLPRLTASQTGAEVLRGGFRMPSREGGGRRPMTSPNISGMVEPAGAPSSPPMGLQGTEQPSTAMGSPGSYSGAGAGAGAGAGSYSEQPSFSPQQASNYGPPGMHASYAPPGMHNATPVAQTRSMKIQGRQKGFSAKPYRSRGLGPVSCEGFVLQSCARTKFDPPQPIASPLHHQPLPRPRRPRRTCALSIPSPTRLLPLTRSHARLMA